MAEAIVSDWLAEYNSLEPQEIRSFAALHAENHELSTAIQTILNDKTKHPDLLHPICIQLYNFYRSNENELKCFTLQFIPNFIFLYLNAVAMGEKQSVRCVETLILCAYNIEVCSSKGLLKSVSYRMPVLAQPSIYHEERNLSASDLKRWEEHCNKEISWRSMNQVYKITAQNRLSVMAALLFVFNQQMSLIPKSALYHLCKISTKLATQGFTKHGHSYRPSYGSDPLNNSMSSASMASSTSTTPNIIKQNPRIPMSQQFLVELLHAIYFAMFNEFASAAIQAVDDIHNRACYELYPDVILVTNAIKNSLQANPSGQPSDGPMGISVALTPATTVVTVSKSMITNASFRTKKLPDDIPIQIDASSGHSHANAGSQQNQPLGSINEEQENDPNSAKTQQGKSGKDGATKSHKAPFGGLKKLIDREKDKDKDKDKDKEKEKNILKSGLSETKESVKKLMGKDKQNSKASLQLNVEPEPQIHISSNNNGDLKNPPNSLIMKRPSDIISDGGIDMATFIEKSLPDAMNISKFEGGVSNGSHGIMSPFEALNNDDSDSDGAIVDPPHQQLSSSSSASVNIMMDNSSSNNKMIGNVQVSQV